MEALGLEGTNGRRIMALRMGAHTIALALVTGIGLFVVGDARSTVAWIVFALATSSAFFLVSMCSRSLLRTAGAEANPRPGGNPVFRELTSSVPAEPPKAVRSSQSPPDQVDYLMALRHEFRTPLNAVLGFSDVLLSGIDGEVNASQREDLEIIRASGIRLRVLLDSALDLSQLVQGELRLETERVDVGELVRRVSVEAGQLWSNKRAARCTSPARPCLADVDETRLRRSLLVLADFLATNHRNAEVSISLAPSNGHLAIEMKAEPSDGVPLDALPTPQEAFIAEDVAKIRRWPVAVTSEIIAQHRGSLYHGHAPSRFLVRLPLEASR